MHIFQKGNEGKRIYKHARIKDVLGSFRFFFCLDSALTFFGQTSGKE